MEKLNPHFATLLTLGMWLIAACTPTPEKNTTVYIIGDGANGTNPYSTSSGAPTNWKCSVPVGQYQIESIDAQFDIIMVKNCWISNKNKNVSRRSPAVTRTPYPTPNVWIKGTP